MQTVAIAPDLKHIVVTAGMVPGASDYLRERTPFWIVKPRIGVGGVSGLGTLLSGAYIGLAPAKARRPASFTGLEQPPPIDANVAGRRVHADRREPGLGQPGRPDLLPRHRHRPGAGLPARPGRAGLDIAIFVRAPYSDLVRTTSRFWNASGISVATGPPGIDVQVGSLQSLLIGGIEFDTPLGTGAGEVADAGASFPLYPNKTALAQAQFTQKIPFLVYFDGSVRGLSPGAPVEFRGITVGVGDQRGSRVRPGHRQDPHPRGIEIEPQRLVPGGFTKEEMAANEHRRMAELVRRGLRAQLQTGNLLTGELFVDLTFAADAPPAELDTSGPIPVIPSVPATIEALQASVTAIMNKVAGPAGRAARRQPDQDRRGLEAIVNAPDIQEAAKSLGETMAQVQQTLGRIDAGADPLLGSVTTAAVSADATLRQAQATMASIQRTVGPASALTDDAESVMQELARAARSIRVFADYLDRHPEALLRGKAGGADR